MSVTKPIVLDTTFAAKLDRTNSILERIANAESQSIFDWSELVATIDAGNFDSIYVVGDQFTDVWEDIEDNHKKYIYPYQYNQLGNVELENGETLSNRPFMQLHYGHVTRLPFTHQRAFLKCPDGLAPGTYYFTFESNSDTYIVAGDVVCFTTTVAIPEGGRISGCYNAGTTQKSDWKIYSYASDGKTILETITPTFTASGTNLGTQKLSARNGNLNSTNEMTSGHNRWKTSAIRQYLNSDAPVGEWWSAQDEWDIAPDELYTASGFLRGCSSGLVDAMKKIKVTTYYNSSASDVTYDKVFLPSLQQIYCSPQVQGEGAYHEYWKLKSGASSPLALRQTYAKMIVQNVASHASATGIALRSADINAINTTWHIFANGLISTSSASDLYRAIPTFVI